MTWIPLHTHSQYTILNATPSIKQLVKRAKEYGLDSLALTDHCNLFGAVEFFKACKGEGIKPIVGLEMMISPGAMSEKKKQYGVSVGYPVTLIAKNGVGYRNLCKISSIGYLEGFYYTPRIDKETLEKYCEGLICLSGPIRGRIGSLIVDDQTDEAKKEVEWFKSLFGDDFYLEIQRHRMEDPSALKKEMWLYREYELMVERQEKVIEAYKGMGVPLVATNDIQYLNQEDYKVHEILMNVQSGEPIEIWDTDHMGNRKGKVLNPKRRVLFSHEYYFKSPEQMEALFSDLPEAISNTKKIADQCSIEFDFEKKFYPVFVPPELEGKEYSDEERKKGAKEYLRKLSIEGMEYRYTEERLAKVKEVYPDRDPMDVVKERFEYEFELIASKEMCDYLLIVHDFIAWAKSQNIPVGPGRGSGAGSIILYLIGITDIEPLRFHLFFERFINPERLSYPDIDVDICMERRSEVIDYTLSKYGKEKVAQIITFGTMKAKMAIKDVGRVLNVSLPKVNEIAKLVPDDLTITLQKALDVDPDFKRMYDTDDEAKQVIDYALKLEGTVRNTGIHAAGLIICGEPLTDHIPICNSKDTTLAATQFAMKPVEAVGMLKIDFLGLKTLTSIQKTVDAIELATGNKIDWVNLGLDDKATFELLNHGKTSGVFQLESGGMQDLAKQLHIDKFEEIIAVGALYRPGPMEMIPSFIRRKHGKEQIENDHPWMKDILSETYGIIVYQEQVMQIAQTLAGYSLGEGDVLRKAMGKKDLEVMQMQQEKFCKGASERGIDTKLAKQIFEKVEKFASYGFNKSHATAYGYLSYVTAYLKANYPREWMAALMSCDIVDLTKISKHIRECQSMNIAILPPDVNESRLEFVATKGGVRFALAAIKGVGEGVVESIVTERGENGLFTSLVDFMKRLDPKKVGKKTIECMIEAGCFDFTKKSRSQLLAILHHHYDAIVSLQKEKAKGIMDLFASDSSNNVSDDDAVEFEEAHKLYLLQKEKELLGFYITGHPLLECKGTIDRLAAGPIFMDTEAKVYATKAAFILETVAIKIAQKSGKKFAVATISDDHNRHELLFWADQYENNVHLLVENQLVLGVLVVDQREDPPRVQCKAMESLVDLTPQGERQIEDAFEQAIMQAQQGAARPARKKSFSNEGKKMEESQKKILFTLDVSKMNHSDILKLKKILREHPGGNELHLTFKEGDQQVGKIEIDGAMGVDDSKELKAAIESLTFCLD